jgi:uncharacterized protein YyaL (SSP411 family)
MPTNSLIREKSPYLLQHAHNPVDWLPWSEEAFRKAREEDKPIFLSVGYSTCHWCHVMERESFENEEIAAFLNQHFVPVKVDREERPDVDRIYMLFVQATSGGGGWPMSVWLTPELKPFFGGTYFAPDARYGRPGFRNVLAQLAAAWKTQRAKLVESAEQIIGDLSKYANVGGSQRGLPSQDAPGACYQGLRRGFDAKLGGFGGAPKFPRPVTLNFLLRYCERAGDHTAPGQNASEKDAREMALLTLREMAKGGMHDQLGGGFHRYSVDENWFVPHFEKMLYDQAQLASSYIEAYQITRDEQYARVAADIFEYVLRDMRHPDGGFYCAEDADSASDSARPEEKNEGAFYIWSRAELEALLGEERAAWFARVFGCRANGNVDNDPHGEFTGRNILYQAEPLSGTDMERFAECQRILLEIRGRRPRPHLDDKILTSWNAMMISAFARGSQALEAVDAGTAARYREAAIGAWRFVMTNLCDVSTKTVYRRWREGERAIVGFLDDYATLLQAHLDLYETTFESSFLDMARWVADVMLERFADANSGGLFSSAQASDVVLRLKEDYDGAEPAGNSVAVGALLRLAAYTRNEPYHDAGLRILSGFASRLNDQPVTLPQMMCAWMFELAPKRQIVIAGPSPEPFLREVRQRFLPSSLVFVNPSEGELGAMTSVAGQTAAYVCENYACQLPVTTVAEFAAALDGE